MNKIITAALISATLFIVGCESDSNGSFNSGSQDGNSQTTNISGDIVGSWDLTATDGSKFYIHFASNGSFEITDDSAGNVKHITGNYTASGDSFKGNMNNPGVGTGEINGTVSGNTLSLNFIEHWHTPYKTIVFSGVKYNK